MIQLTGLRDDQRFCELGCGNSPLVRRGVDVCVDVRTCHDHEGKQVTDFVCDFEQPLPIGDEDFHGAVCKFALEHITYRKVPGFLSEVWRIVKPGAKVLFITPNTELQFNWLKANPEGWDGKGLFESASCILYGDQDYSDNTHKCYLTPDILLKLFADAGFEQINIQPYGARATDLILQAVKGPRKQPSPEQVRAMVEAPLAGGAKQEALARGKQQDNVLTKYTREELFDKHYFNSGSKVGGYAREGYRDFPVHRITLQHILKRKPKSVLEIGAARGHILKMLQDRGVPACGLEISKHCWMTRACDGIICKDICKFPWPWKDKEFDLLYDIAVLEHIPEEFVPGVIGEIKRVSNRSLHGIDFGKHDDGFDKTHATLRDKEWWEKAFAADGNKEHKAEIVDKEELEKGEFNAGGGDGKTKLNIGSHMVMFHDGWTNIDVHDLHGFAHANAYKYLQHDVMTGLPFDTGSVDSAIISHMLEHLSYEDGRKLLLDCRRALHPEEGYLRVLVPDTELLTGIYLGDPEKLLDFEHINDGVTKNKSPAEIYHALLYENHKAIHDSRSLVKLLEECGFKAWKGSFREARDPRGAQTVRETLDMFPCLSLIVEAVPKA